MTIGETLADVDDPVALPAITVDEPSLAMTIGINTSPLSGTDGTKLTARLLKARLDSELVGNVAIQVEADRPTRPVGGARPGRAAAGRAGRDHAPRGLRDDRRQAPGRDPRRSTARRTSRWSGCRWTCPTTISAW